MNSLGETLKLARKNAHLTLIEVGNKVGHSNAYLSLLENDKIKKPSADCLYKLSVLYKITFDSLLIASGIITESQIVSVTQSLTPEEEKELIKYLRFLRSNLDDDSNSKGCNKKL